MKYSILPEMKKFQFKVFYKHIIDNLSVVPEKSAGSVTRVYRILNAQELYPLKIKLVPRIKRR